MDKLLGQLKIKVNEKIYLKDPESSHLGRAILKNSIELINEIGFEAFTFKKLGQKIGSPESSVYRYFENKHRVLLYLISWYWNWLEYQLVFTTINIESPKERLIKAIQLLTAPIEEDSSISYINEILLTRIIISESFKAYHIKKVDVENKEGFYKPYKRLVQRVSDMVLAVNPAFRYPHMLISTVVEGAHHQRFFTDHIPSLTTIHPGDDDVTKFYVEMVLATIKPSNE